MLSLLRAIKGFVITWFLPRKPVVSEDNGTEMRQKDFRQIGREVFRAKHDFDKEVEGEMEDSESQDVVPFQIKAPEGDETRVSR